MEAAAVVRLEIVTSVRHGVSGQSHFERHLTSALSEHLCGRVHVSTVGGLREKSATIRIPTRVTRSLPYSVRSRIAARLYRAGDVVHRLDLAAPPHRREVLTVHDLAPLRFLDEGGLPSDWRESLRRARVLITGSHYIADELETRTGRRDIVVIGHGVDPELVAAPRLSDVELAGLGIVGPFVLHAGGVSERKNLRALVEAWSEVTRAYPGALLVTCGPDHPVRRALFSRAARHLYMGPVERAVLGGLMKRASAVVVPSLYEGFGLPALEAMACSAPVVASRAASLPEVCGEAAILTEPSPRELAFGLLVALTEERDADRIAAGRAQAAKYSWDAAAKAHLAVYSRL